MTIRKIAKAYMADMTEENAVALYKGVEKLRRKNKRKSQRIADLETELEYTLKRIAEVSNEGADALDILDRIKAAVKYGGDAKPEDAILPVDLLRQVVEYVGRFDGKIRVRFISANEITAGAITSPHIAPQEVKTTPESGPNLSSSHVKASRGDK